MRDIYFLCPHCKQRLEAPVDMAGERINCPSCDQRIAIPSPQTPPPQVSSLGDAKTMAGAMPSEQADLVGRTFGKDVVKSKIAEGGMGSVWLTEHTELKMARALKTMPEGFGSQPELVQRFQQEATILAHLHHANIAQIYDFDSRDGIYYFIMEYLPNGSLRSRLRPPGTRLPWRDALAILDQVCAGLDYAHGKGVIHRDIKPENILLDEQGHPKIADFGLGKILHDVVRSRSGSLIMGRQAVVQDVSLGASPTMHHGTPQQAPLHASAPAAMTMMGQVVGTLDYMSPEQRRGGEVTGQSDIYSLGVTFFEMLTGELPSGMETPSERGADCPPGVDALVKRMLAPPDRRFASASEVRDAIAKVTDQPAPPPPSKGSGGGRRILAGLLVGLLTVALGGISLALYQYSKKRVADETASLLLETQNEPVRVQVATPVRPAPDRPIAEAIPVGQPVSPPREAEPQVATAIPSAAPQQKQISQELILCGAGTYNTHGQPRRKPHPSSAQIIDSSGDVAGEVLLEFKDFDHAIDMFFIGPDKKKTEICSFRETDSVGQVRMGKAGGLSFSGRITELTLLKDRIDIITIQVSAKN